MSYVDGLIAFSKGSVLSVSFFSLHDQVIFDTNKTLLGINFFKVRLNSMSVEVNRS